MMRGQPQENKVSENQTLWCFCPHCGHETRHKILATKETTEHLTFERECEEIISGGTNEFTLLECLGCERICLRHKYVFEAANDRTIQYYPPPLYRRLPTWLYSIPESMRSLLREVYAALAADSRRLAVMGARSILDQLMADKVGDVGSFARKLKEMEVKGFISHLNRDYLEAALDAGSAAIHRGHEPSADIVERVMDIVENVIEAVYVLPGAGRDLRKDTPPRG